MTKHSKMLMSLGYGLTTNCTEHLDTSMGKLVPSRLKERTAPDVLQRYLCKLFAST